MKNLLIVVDYQKDFVDGSLGFPKAAALDAGIAKKIDAYRRRGDDVFFTMDTHDRNNYLHTQEGKKLPVPHCLEGTAGWELYGKTAKARQPGDPVFCKNTFGSSQLFQALYSSPSYRKIELVGLVSGICVIANAVLVKTAQPRAEVLVDSRLTAAGDEELQKAALKVMESLQITIL